MKKNFFSLLSASLFISSSVIAAESADDFVAVGRDVYYTIHPKNMPEHYITFAAKENDKGHYVQVAFSENPGSTDRWKIKAATKAPGYFKIIKDDIASQPFIIYNDEKSAKGKYMQMTSLKEPGGRGLWKIKPAKKAPGYFKLVPKNFPKFSATYTDERTPRGFFMQIASYKNPGNELFFSVVPHNYTLATTLTKFNFGDDINKRLEAAAVADYSSVQTVQVKDKNLGVKIGGEYKNDIEESFTWGLNETLNISVGVSLSGGIPFLASGELNLGGSFEFGAHQTWVKSKTKSFIARVEMNPSKPGTYKIGNIVYIANNVELPFTAMARYTALSEGKPLLTKGVEALCRHNGLKSKIISRDNDSISVAVSGTLKATYGVYQEAVAEKIG
ncbi:MAG: hypothetical protein K0M45_05135 [Candidatus Paracaedibacteraceae bacterium]|nr:hypothetical protein [Candidatus Paracaedibacteraceae bacterium]